MFIMISVKLWNVICLTSVWCGLVPSWQQAIGKLLRFNGTTYKLIWNSSVTPVWYWRDCCLSLRLVWFCFVFVCSFTKLCSPLWLASQYALWVRASINIHLHQITRLLIFSASALTFVMIRNARTTSVGRWFGERLLLSESFVDIFQCCNISIITIQHVLQMHIFVGRITEISIALWKVKLPCIIGKLNTTIPNCSRIWH